MNPERLNRLKGYASPWVNVFVDRVRLETGRIIERQHVLDVPNESVVVVLSDEADRYLSIETFRYLTDSQNLECPAGGVESGEPPIEAARREVREETGYVLEYPEYLFSYHPSNGMSNQRVHIVRGKVGNREGSVDPNEVRRLHRLNREELEHCIEHGGLSDGFSLVAILASWSNGENRAPLVEA